MKRFIKQSKKSRKDFSNESKRTIRRCIKHELNNQ